MTKKVIYVTLGVMLLAVGSLGEAQQSKKVFRIGYLSSFDPAFESTRFSNSSRFPLKSRLRIFEYFEYIEREWDKFSEKKR